ncbi:MAG: DUF3142 domain-containing protein [Limisphaerales bacterium]
MAAIHRPLLSGLAAGVLALALALTTASCRREPRASGALAHDAYLWQRAWTPEVKEAVHSQATAFGTLSILFGEIGWASGSPKFVRVASDAGVLREIGPSTRIGIALRVGPFSGPFEADDATARFLRSTASDCLRTAREAGIEVAEFQIDFDCPDRRLDGYRVWVAALRRDLAPVPLILTALPSWLNQRTFPALAKASDGFVLQVHSLARPANAQAPAILCDPASARRSVDRAARVAPGVPFRVALPTYGYLLAFDADGDFLGASAEGPAPARPRGTLYRELNADPIAMAQLVADWTGDRPASMTGLIWYRLPVAGDRLNWRWPTLETVMAGTAPSARLVATPESPEPGRDIGPGLIEVALTNRGSANFQGPVAIRVRWTGAQRLGADGIRGFEAIYQGSDEVLFTNAICRLPAGEGGRIGWVRLDSHAEITVEQIVPPRRPEP